MDPIIHQPHYNFNIGLFLMLATHLRKINNNNSAVTIILMPFL
jgi:hypothetical protein